MGRIAHLVIYAPAVADLIVIIAGLPGPRLLTADSNGIPAAELAGYARLAACLCLLSLVTLHLFDLYSGWLRAPLAHLTYFTFVSSLLMVMYPTRAKHGLNGPPDALLFW